MNITQAIVRACEEPTLLDALSWICIWESERAIKQARENSGWDTRFKYYLEIVMQHYANPQHISNSEFIPTYMLLMEYIDGDVEIVKRNELGSPVVAIEGNQYLLREIGDKLLEKGRIIGYQLVKTISAPTRKS